VGRGVGLTALALTAVGTGLTVGLGFGPGRVVADELIRRVAQGALAPGWTVQRPRLRVYWGGGLTLDGLTLRNPDGEAVITAAHLAIDLGPVDLRAPSVQIDGLRADGVDVTLDLDDQGVLDLVRAFGGPAPPDPDAPPWAGLPLDLTVAGVDLRDGRFRLRRRGAQGVSVLVEVDGIGARADAVRLPLARPAVLARGAEVSGLLVHPGPVPVAVVGDVDLDGGLLRFGGDGSGALGDLIGLAVGETAGALRGGLDLAAPSLTVDASLALAPLHLPSLEPLIHAGLAGTWVGGLTASGPLHSLGLTLDVDGAADRSGGPTSRGHLALAPGSVLCLPVAHPDAPDACGGPPGDTELRWVASARPEGFYLEDLLPVVRGPLRLEGTLDAAGHGTAWPHGFALDRARYTAPELDVFGLTLRDASAEATLVDGVLEVGAIALTGVAGRATGRGRLDIETGALRVDATGALDLAMLAELGVTDVSGHGRFTAALTGRVRDPGAPLDVTGEIGLDALHYTDQVTLEQVRGRYRAHVADAITDVDADITAARGSAWGAALTAIAAPDLHVRVDERITVTGTGGVRSAAYGDHVHVEEIEAPFTFTRPRQGGPNVLEAAARVGPVDLRGLMANHGDVGVRLIDSDLALDVDLRWDDDPFLVAHDLRVDLATLTLDAPSLVFAPTGRQTWTAQRPLHLRVTETGVAEADIALRAAQGGLELRGDLGTTGALRGGLTLDALDLDALAELAPDLFSDYDGVLDATVSFAGTARQPDLMADLRADDLYLPGNARWLDLEGTVGVRRDVLDVDLRGRVNDVELFTLDGYTPVHSDLRAPGLSDDGKADVHLTLLPGRLDRFEQLLPGTDLPEGALSASFQLGDLLRDPSFDLHLVGEVDVEGLDGGARLELEVARADATITVHADGYEGLRPTLTLDGTAATRLSEVMHWLLEGGPQPDLHDARLFADHLDLALGLTDLPTDTLQALAGLDLDLDGALTGEVLIHGAPDAPTLDAGLLLVGEAAGAPFQQRLALAHAADGYHLTATLGDDLRPWVRVEGLVPAELRPLEPWTAWSTGDLDLQVDGTGIPLELARLVDAGFVPLDDEILLGARRRTAAAQARRADNHLEIAGVVRGPLHAPTPDVSAHLRGARFAYRPLGVTARDVALEAHLGPAGDGAPGHLRVDLTTLRATTAPMSVSLGALNLGATSSIALTGALDLPGGALGVAHAEADLREAWLMAGDDRHLRASGTVAVDGVFPALTVTGDLTVDQALATLDAGELLATRDMHLDPALTVHRATPRGEREVTTGGPSPLDAMDVALHVDLGRRARGRIHLPIFDDLGAVGATVTRAQVDAEVQGEVDVQVRRGAVSVAGDVGLPSGSFGVLASEFALAPDSHLTFLGADVANPRLDIGGTMAVTGGEVRLRVSGTAGAPKVELTSDDFGSQAELFTILLTGQAPEDLSSTEGRAAIQAVSKLLVDSVLGGVNLGSVSVEPDGTVTFGLPLLRQLYLESQFTPAPGLNENNVTVKAEWSILPKLVLTAAYGNRHIWGLLNWELRF
jgi:hypothetical protein